MKRAAEALSIAILLLSAVLAWRLGFSLGASDAEKHILALTSVALEGWKVLLPFVLYKAWEQRRLIALGFGLLLWPLLTTYSFVGGLAFSELNRATIAGNRGAAVERTTTQKAELADISSRLAAIKTKRAATEIAAAIEARRQVPIRAGADTKTLIEATRSCNDVVSKRSVDVCAEIATLTQELAQANERQRLEARRDEIRATLATASGLDWEGIADPQVAALAALTGGDAITVRRVINIGFAALLELVGGLGLFFASLLAPTELVRQRQAATQGTDITPPSESPETDEQRLARYLAARTRTETGAFIVASKLHADYSRWVHEQGSAPVSLTTFGNLVAKQGIHATKCMFARNRVKERGPLSTTTLQSRAERSTVGIFETILRLPHVCCGLSR